MYSFYQTQCNECGGTGTIEKTLTQTDHYAYGKYSNDYGKMPAIKLVRHHIRSFGLKAAKDYIEQMAIPAYSHATLGSELFETMPTPAEMRKNVPQPLV